MSVGLFDPLFKYTMQVNGKNNGLRKKYTGGPGVAF